MAAAIANRFDCISDDQASELLLALYQDYHYEAPTPHARARERVVRQYIRKLTGPAKTKCKVTPKERLKDFPNSHLVVCVGKPELLFCEACKTEHGTKKENLKTHLRTKKHKKNVEAFLRTKTRLLSLSATQSTVDARVQPVGTTLSPGLRAWRTSVVRSMAKAGMVLSKLHDANGTPTSTSHSPPLEHVHHTPVIHAHLLVLDPDFTIPPSGGASDLARHIEEGCYPLGGDRTLRDQVPVAMENHLEEVRDQVQGVDGSLLYDGASVTCPAEAAMFRFVQEVAATPDSETKWIIKQLLIRFHLVEGALISNEMFGFLLDSCRKVGIDRTSIIGTPRDRHSVNEKAQKLLFPLLPRNTDLPCTCHTLSNTGFKIDVPILGKYMKNYNNLLGKSHACALLFKTCTGESAERFSIKWLSKAFQTIQHFRLWVQLLAFYQQVVARGLSKKSAAKQIKLLTSPAKRKKLSLEMSVIMDIAAKMIQDLTFLEGDAYLAPFTFQRIQGVTTLFAVFASGVHPNLTIVAEKIAALEHPIDSPEYKERLEDAVEYGRARVEPASAYWAKRYCGPNATLLNVVQVFEACQLFDPRAVSRYYHKAKEWLARLPLFTEEERLRLLDELPVYLSLVQSLDDTDKTGPDDLIQWFCNHRETIPQFARGSRKIAVLQPSEGAVERVYALCNSMFSPQQKSTLEDAVSSCSCPYSVTVSSLLSPFAHTLRPHCFFPLHQMSLSVMTAYNERVANSTRKKVNLGLDKVPGHYANLIQFEGGCLL
jgi:hypothetical protein